MNTVILKGNLGRDAELTVAKNSGLAICKFTLAVPGFKKDSPTNWINCIAFGKTGEAISTYFTKGSSILIEGSIQTGSYEAKDGGKRYTTDIIVSKFDFLEKKKDSGFEDMTPIDNGSIPF